MVKSFKSIIAVLLVSILILLTGCAGNTKKQDDGVSASLEDLNGKR